MSEGKFTIGVMMIVKNEEKHLKASLESISGWVDQIVILDSGSTDHTLNIAKVYTDKIYEKLDWEGFGKQRQVAQSYLSTDWVLVLDADEIVTEELKLSLLQAASNRDQNICYQINRYSKAFGKYIWFSGWSPDWIVRFYPRNVAGYNDALVHEKVVMDAGVRIAKISKGKLLHDTYDNLHHYIAKTTGYIKAWSDQREGRKKSGLTTALVHAWGCFIRMYFIKLGFLDGRHGFILAWLGMHSTFVKYIDLWLRENSKKDK